MKQSREQRFYPWAYDDHGLRLRVANLSLDGRPSEAGDPRPHSVELGGDWTRAALELEVRAPRRIWRRLVSEHERDVPPLAVLVTLSCARTYLRRRVGLRDWATVEGGRARFVLALDRDEFAGFVEIDAHLIRTATARDDPGEGASVATRPGTRLAGSRTLTLIIDPPEVRTGNYLDVQYRRFHAEPSAPDPRALYELELEGEAPILYLNADHEALRPTLDSKGTRGSQARVRDLLFERIAAGVWTQLVTRACMRLVDDGEPAYAWEQAVLDQWLPRLYPDQAPDARPASLERELPDLPAFLARLDGVLQVEGKLAELATKLMGELS